MEALIRRYYPVHPTCNFAAQVSSKTKPYVQEGGFENVICEYVDSVAIVKKIKNVNKRAILIFEPMGYANWEIARILRISEQAVSQNRKWLKKKIKIIQNK